MEIAVESCPLLDLGAFVGAYPDAIGTRPVPEWLVALLGADAPTPLSREESVRVAVRDMLRSGGFKPTGRSKPASEYLVRAAGEGRLGSINLAVDAANAASLHGGLPISVVDADRLRPPLRIELAPAGASYVFNASGQRIDVGGLPCLIDAEGPCANAVKDAQRTKTSDATRTTLSLVWGTEVAVDRTVQVVDWYRQIVEGTGATTRLVEA